MPAGEGRAERLEGGRQRLVGRRQAGPQRVASAGYFQGLQDPEPRGNLEPAQVGVPGELRRRMGRGVLDHRYRLLASGESLQRVHRHVAEARRHLPEAPLVSAESPDEHDVVDDDELTAAATGRRARSRGRRRRPRRRSCLTSAAHAVAAPGGRSRWRAVGRRGSVPNRGGRWRTGHLRIMRHRHTARTVLGDTFRHPFTFTHDTVGHIGRTWGVSWSEGPMCLAGRSTFRPTTRMT